MFFCKRNFKNISSLNNHIKTAKYCLALRNKNVIFMCEYCDKKFSSKYGLDKHTINCYKIYVDIKSKIEKEYIIKLEEQKINMKKRYNSYRISWRI